MSIQVMRIFYSQNTYLLKLNHFMYLMNLSTVPLVVKLNKASVYVTGFLLKKNSFESATVTVSNNLPISLPFDSFFSFSNSHNLIYIWF